jgi:hypothetical protein
VQLGAVHGNHEQDEKYIIIIIIIIIVYIMQSENLKRIDHFGDLGMYQSIIL